MGAEKNIKGLPKPMQERDKKRLADNYTKKDRSWGRTNDKQEGVKQTDNRGGSPDKPEQSHKIGKDYEMPPGEPTYKRKSGREQNLRHNEHVLLFGGN